ncbi:hypothetical protein MBLNU230_g4244t1 [Neophaeotheca triangularis]
MHACVRLHRLAPVSSQHSLGTQTVVLKYPHSRPDEGVLPEAAEVRTYFTGIHFGRGRWEGSNVVAYGEYVDFLVCDWEAEDGEERRERGGVWRVARRVTRFMGRVGEEGVMDGEKA